MFQGLWELGTRWVPGEDSEAQDVIPWNLLSHLHLEMRESTTKRLRLLRPLCHSTPGGRTET